MAIRSVPCNIITGFLGVGKTSTILHLLKHKPADERWAVLVNEFGEVGIDGSLLNSSKQEQEQVFIREVPGGCMCCAAGLPMHIALNQLLQRAKPDRLLIEPSGLGHPREVMQVLHSEHYQDVLDIQQCLTLVDARKLNDERYTEHDIFLQQIDIADVIVANKEDLCRPEHKQLLEDFLPQRGQQDCKVLWTVNGEIPPSLLTGHSQFKNRDWESLSLPEADSDRVKGFDDTPLPESGFLSRSNQSDDFSTIGWRFEPNTVFNHSKLYRWASDLIVERMKAVCITEDGVWGFNKTPDGLQELELDDCMESRFEIIANSIDPNWEAQLMDCRLPS
ncbi:CobW family GTP-binding protein [Pseudoteredinibacter isoporae]|uniref:G3E family GTPase n=1 Tax=Pseudoteredinibacter isoporae TaxID=570281 RepID=A0A7X0MVL7_9GAMM|nr:GTP-binding protein [Pseudoteredinibacter isoporae]MBB6521250.1 G3E family GTPase [Pseudoteredinibacter isoporae]NHO86808.1 GTP-binding protein [Pseudoteredinibacter isoporae]NIB24740.1 GTP-binding protein [Pseudoteredinibacter isoporae]